MKAITFLGTGRYEETVYTWDDRKSTPTQFFPIAVWELFEPDEFCVFVTPRARTAHWHALQKQCATRIVLHEVPIPNGESEAELWEIFDAVVSAVEEDDTVLFDITHAFRSIPLIVLLAVAYLKTARGVTLGRIVYGAFEASDREAGTTPVFDITPMASLLDWLAALHLFRETGRGGELAGLLRQIQAGAHRSGQADAPEGLIPVGQSLLRLSEDLRLIRPLDALEQARVLSGQLETERLAEIDTWAKPFTLVAPLVQAEAARLAGEPAISNLVGQAALLDWYVTHEQPVQALTLAREMVVSWVARELGESDLCSEAARKRAEALLNWWGCQRARKSYRGELSEREIATLAWSEERGKEVGTLWNALAEPRNDVNHAGMRPQADSARTLQSKVRKLITGVQRLVGDGEPQG